MRPRDHFSAISHLLGALLSTAGLVTLIIYAQKISPWHVIGFTIFGVSLILLYTASTIYHFLHISSKAKRIFRKIDHSLIFVLIAGTFTPVCLTVLRGPWGWTMFGITWGFAIGGIITKAYWNMPGWLSTVFYIGMGWLAVVAFAPLKQSLPTAALYWLFAGGLFYTAGAGFFGLDDLYPSHKWFNFHDLFHIFVLLGSACHFVLMLYLV
jgi:hemolysin III